MITSLNTFMLAILLLYCQSNTEKSDAINNVNSDGPSWAWAKKVALTYRIIPSAYAEMITDEKGNSYLTNYVPTTLNSDDVLLVKYDYEGNKLWEVTAGGKGRDSGQDIAFDRDGNIWIVGYFYKKAQFGDFTLIGDNDYNMFIAKYDNSGKCLVALKPATNNDGFNYSYGEIGNGHIGGFFLAISNKNELFLSNIFQGSISFGSIKLNSNPENAFAATIFIAKLDISGKCKWATKMESSTPCYLGVAHFNPNGNTYILSYCSKKLSVGDIEFIKKGSHDSGILLAKVDENGNCNWIKQIATRIDSENQQEAINAKHSDTVDEGETFYISGRVTGMWQFGPNLFETDGSEHSFVLKLNSEGKILQLIPLAEKGKPGGQWIWDFTTDANDNIYVTGQCTGSCYFGGQQISPQTTTSAYVAKYTSNGELDWVNVIPCDGLVIWPRSIHVRGNMLFLSGNYRLRATFDDTILENNNTHEIFIARLDL